MHSPDGIFCKTLDRGVELWLLEPHAEPCLSHVPLGSPAGPPVFVAALKDGKIIGKVIYLPIPILLDRGNVVVVFLFDDFFVEVLKQNVASRINRHRCSVIRLHELLNRELIAIGIAE